MNSVSQSSVWPTASKRQVASWRKLATKKGRRESGQILIEGARLISESLLTGCRINHLLIADDKQGYAAARALEVSDRPLSECAVLVKRRSFEQLTDTVHSSGLAAILEWHALDFDSFVSGRSRCSRILYCDHIADPGNLGTLIRTAAGLGVDAVFTHPATVECSNPKTMRATAGAIFRIPVVNGVPVARAGDWMRKQRIVVLIADPHRGKPLDARIRPRRWCLVVGGETQPLDPLWTRERPRHVRIPLRSGVESLNAGVAGAILLDRLCRNGRS